ncbi:MAG: hypothetical protein ACE5GB_15010, partial [Acidimicrobiales bacterium]
MSEHRYLPSQTFTKRATGAARGRRRREAVHLALVAGPGVVPLEGLSDDGEEVRFVDVVDRAAGQVDERFAGVPLVRGELHILYGNIYGGL